MPLDDNYDWANDNDEDEHGEELESDWQNQHKELERGLQEKAQIYDSQWSHDDREAHLQQMRDDIDAAIESRKEENERIGDDYGRLETHEERIRVLEANKAALQLESYYNAEEAASGTRSATRSAWNDETQQFGEFKVADYEAEVGPDSGDGDDDEGSDMDIAEDSDDD